jgi:hypothetical protein
MCDWYTQLSRLWTKLLPTDPISSVPFFCSVLSPIKFIQSSQTIPTLADKNNCPWRTAVIRRLIVKIVVVVKVTCRLPVSFISSKKRNPSQKLHANTYIDRRFLVIFGFYLLTLCIRAHVCVYTFIVCCNYV